jgi:hypothetical protein
VEAGAKPAAPLEKLEMPSLEMPSGLTENGRDQFGALLAVMLSLVGELSEVDRQVPADCSPVLEACRDRWEQFAASLNHVVEQLDTPWFDCHGLDAIDARAFVETARRYKAYLVARIQVVDERVDAMIVGQNWGPAASRSWRALSARGRLSSVRQPTCQ